MRLYTFSNYYLSSIQQSIQALHVTSELFVKYPNELHDVRSVDHKLHDWAKNHKTVVCLNGGNNQGLIETYDTLEVLGNFLTLPYAKFHEDDQSLGGIMTCCGIVVPENIYEAAQALRDCNTNGPEFEIDLNPVEKDLAMFLNQFGLAR